MAVDVVIVSISTLVSLIALLVLERFANVVLFLVFAFITNKDSSKVFPAMQVVSVTYQYVLNLTIDVINLAVGVVSATAWNVVAFVVIFFFMTCLFLLYEEYPGTIRSLGIAYNTWFGPAINFTVISLLRLLVVVFEHIVPLYNGYILIFQKAFKSSLMTGFFQTGNYFLAASTDMGFILASMSKSTGIFFSAFRTRLYQCDTLGAECFEVVQLDMRAPLLYLPSLTRNVVSIIFGMCPILSVPVDILSYPLMDPNVPGIVHHFVNAIIHWLVEMPRITAQRCHRHKSDIGIVMCVPDVRRLFENTARLIESISLLVDNWLDMVLLIIESAIEPLLPDGSKRIKACQEKDKRQAAFSYTNSYFENEPTVMAGITSALFAVTNGKDIQWIDAGHTMDIVETPLGMGWPIEIDVGYGVAVVDGPTGTDLDGSGAALLGCRCEDVDGSVAITCAIAPHYESVSDNTPPHTFSVGFQVPQTAQYMQCSRMKISVQSIRWPSVRYTSIDENVELLAKGSVDAAIWVMPLCGTAGPFPAVCSESFVDAACFPYCMALHTRSSPARNLVLYNAPQWREYVHLLQRDCVMRGLPSANANNPLGLIAATAKKIVPGAKYVAIAGGVISDAVTGQVGQPLECYANPVAYSVVPISSHNSYKESTNFVRLVGQPFVFAGDIMLTGNYDVSPPTVTVWRVTGNSRSEFTMMKVLAEIPANPPLDTLASMTTLLSPDVTPTEVSQVWQFDERRLTLPYRFGTTAYGINAAAQSEDSVYFAINPSMHMFKAYSSYCSSIGYMTQLAVISKYHPPRITRIRPSSRNRDLDLLHVFVPGAINLDGDGAPDFLSLIYGGCDMPFYAAITHIEYIDPLNVAVSVLRTTMTALLDPFAAKYSAVTRIDLFYLKTTTGEMRLNDPWQPPLPEQPSDRGIRLCPGLRRMPTVGSMIGESALAMHYLLRTVIEIPLTLIAMIPLWEKTVACPLRTYGHTMLQRCGEEIFNVDDFFSSIYKSNRHFWRIISTVADLLPVGSITGFLAARIIGFSKYGSGSLRPYMSGTSMQVVQAFNTPIVDKLAQPVRSIVASGGGGFAVPLTVAFSSNVIGVAWWNAKLFNKIISDIIPPAIAGNAVDALSTIWVNMYESQGSFRDLVIKEGYMSCAGLSAMFGYGTPLSDFTLHACETPLKLWEGSLEMALSILVDLAFTACLCQKSDGYEFYRFAETQCLANAPRHMQPLIANWLTFGRDERASCVEMRTRLQKTLNTALDPMYESLFSASDALGRLLDYMRIFVGEDGGECLNFDTDPYVVALVPEPVDYFRVCAQTDYCYTRCGAEIDYFNEIDDGLLWGDDLYEEEVDSYFFLESSQDSNSPFSAVAALLEIPCDARCSGRCLNVIGTISEQGGMVRSYCVPFAPGLGVRKMDDWVIPRDVGSWSLAAFTKRDGSEALVVTSDGGSAKLFVVTLADGGVIHDTDFSIPGVNVERVTQLYAYHDSVMIELVQHKAISSQKWCGYLPSNSWVQCGRAETFFSYAFGNFVIWLTARDDNRDVYALLVPSMPSIEAQPIAIMKLHLDTSGDVLVTESPTPIGTVKSFTAGLGVMEFYSSTVNQQILVRSGRQLAQNSFSVGNKYLIFSSDPSNVKINWLSDVLINVRASDDVFVTRQHSQAVKIDVTVQQECNRRSCAGCVSLQTQKACYVMQQCIIGRCIGTIVNQRRPLCAIGMTVKSAFDLVIQQSRSASMIVLQTLTTVLGLTLGDYDLDVSWPDEAFYGTVCIAKDGIASGVSVITATINNFIQKVLSLPMDEISGGAFSVDGNTKAIVTMSLTAVNFLLFQIGLGILYVPIIVQKLVVCQANSLLAFTDDLGFSVFFGNKDIQQDVQNSFGTCVPDSIDAQTTVIHETGIKGALMRFAGSILRDVGSGSVITAATTTIDAVIAWAKGVITGLQDVVQTMDMAHCKLPDFYMVDVFKCACGDTAYHIHSERRGKKIEDAEFWCSGSLEMVSNGGSTTYIVNPYSMDELGAVMGRVTPQSKGVSGAIWNSLDKYLLCLSRPEKFAEEFPSEDNARCLNLKPSLGKIESQGVDTVAVFGRCRANFQLKEWDAGAWAMFDENNAASKERPAVSEYIMGIGQCLLQAHEMGQGGTACRDDHLGTMKVDINAYFSYESVEGAPNSATIDACEVFTGPASSSENTIFSDCINKKGQGNCAIPPFVWSARSNNKVPVATMHSVQSRTDAEKLEEAQYYFQTAKMQMQEALEKVEKWSNENVESYLFSVEGDFLHQLFDCTIMGAFNRIDFWPSGRKGGLPVPTWWRNTDNTREIPDCRGSMLDGDHQPPFTCGSQTRRGILKHFVRVFYNDEGSARNGTEGNKAIERLIRQKIQELMVAWAYNETSDDLQQFYSCSCSDGSNSFSCCDAGDPDSFTPSRLFVDLAVVDSEAVAKDITDSVYAYFKEELSVDVDPWWQFVNEEKYEWNWGTNDFTSKAAADAGLFSQSIPLLKYDSTETKGPLNNGTETVWETCTGLLGQAMSSLPLKNNETGWFPKKVDLFDFDSEQLLHVAARIGQIQRLDSPLFALRDWRHVPSTSSLCVETTKGERGRRLPRGRMVIDTFTPGVIDAIQEATGTLDFLGTNGQGAAFGPEMFKIGDVGCFCAWNHKTELGKCVLPAGVCSHLRFSEAACTYAMGADAEMRRVVLKDVPVDIMYEDCPLLNFSDHWGVLTDTRAREWQDFLYNFDIASDISLDPNEILRNGRGGMRLGAWGKFASGEVNLNDKVKVRPSARVKRLYNDEGEDLVSQKVCVSLDGTTPIIDNEHPLFPVVQIVKESMPVAACSRYVVESMKHKVLSVNGVVGGTNILSLELLVQQQIMEEWEFRCNQQLHLVSTCDNLGVFDIIPTPAKRPVYSCPYTITGGDSTSHYVTSGCIVYIQSIDKFVDPCLCIDCSQHSSVSLTFLGANTRCLQPFDIRDISQGWGAGVPATFVDQILDRLYEDQLEGEANFGNKDTIGISPNMMSIEYCDGIVDWWPETWQDPVGYHVTTQCHPSEAAYRVFDNAYTVSLDTPDIPVVYYDGTALRDPDKIGSFFGTGGMCRRSTYGMRMLDINPIRVCTQEQEDQKYDPTTPRQPSASSTWLDRLCAPESTDVPWVGESSSVPRSAGLLPFWKVVGATGQKRGTYQNTAGRMPFAGISKGASSFYTHPECTDDLMCGQGWKCKEGVCFPETIECTSHGECESPNVCSGVGTCVPFKLDLVNEANKTVLWDVYSHSCDAYSQYGVSRWGQINGILDAHGFCGYHEWFDYQTMIKWAACESSYSCEVNSALWTWKNSTKYTSKALLDDGVLKLIPHPCDRNYQVTGRAGCAAIGTDRVRVDQYRTHRGGFVDILVQGIFNDRRDIGFLNLGSVSWQSAKLVECSSIPQCSSLPITWNFRTVDRPLFSDVDVFDCAIGMKKRENSNLCYFDKTVIPFARQLCGEFKDTVIGVCNKRTSIIDTVKLQSICNYINYDWDENDKVLKQSSRIINKMFSVFNYVPDTLYGYMDAKRCADALLQFQPSLVVRQSEAPEKLNSVFFAFPHSLKEVPFSWWFQCSLLSTMRLNNDIDDVYVSFPCQSWENWADWNSPNIPADWRLQAKTFDSIEEVKLAELETKITLFRTEKKSSFHVSGGVDYVRSCVKDRYFADPSQSAALQVFENEGGWQCISSKWACLGSVYSSEDGKTRYFDICAPPAECFVQSTGRYVYEGDATENLLERMVYDRTLYTIQDRGDQPIKKGDIDASLKLYAYVSAGSAEVDAWVKNHIAEVGECKRDSVLVSLPVGTAELGIPVFPKNAFDDIFKWATQDARIRQKDVRVLSSGGIFGKSWWDAYSTYDYDFSFGSVGCFESDYLKNFDYRGQEYVGYGKGSSYWYYKNEPFEWKEAVLNGVELDLGDRLPCMAWAFQNGEPKDNTWQAVCGLGNSDFVWGSGKRFKCNTGKTQFKYDARLFKKMNGEEVYAFVPHATCIDGVDGHEYSLLDILSKLNTEIELSNNYFTVEEGEYIPVIGVPYSPPPPVFTYVQFKNTGKHYYPGITILDGQNTAGALDRIQAMTGSSGATFPPNCLESLGSFYCVCAASTENGRYVHPYWEANIVFGNNEKPVDTVVDGEEVDAIRNLYWYEVPRHRVRNTICQGESDCVWPDREPNIDIANAAQERIRSEISAGINTVSIQEDTQSKIYEPNRLTSDRDNFPKFDSSVNQAHEISLLKDPSGNIKCRSVSDASQNLEQIVYAQCNFDGGIGSLNDFVNSHYKEPGAVSANMDEKNTYEVLDILSGIVVAWQSTREIDPLVRNVFDSPARCLEAEFSSSYCRLVHSESDGTTEALVVNPWVGGDFNPSIGCDTRIVDTFYEKVDALCDPQTCTGSTTFSTDMPAGAYCTSRDSRDADVRRVADKSGNNLCKLQKNNAKVCSTEFGLLGDGRGLPASDLYTDSLFECSAESNYMFGADGLSPLLRRETVDNACLQVDPSEIGTTIVEVKLDAKKRVQISKVFLSQTRYTENDDWISTFDEQCALDNGLYDEQYAGEAQLWSTPFERIAFWTGKHERKPLVPDPSRSKLMFANRSAGCGPASPMQGPSQTFPYPSQDIFTPDGICLCMGTEAFCTQQCSDWETHLKSVVRAMLLTDTAILAKTVKQYGNDNKLLDWPFFGGILRDGSPSRNEQPSNHNVLTSLPDFKVSFKIVDTIGDGPEGLTTSSDGGDCHMGYAATKAKSLDISDCKLKQKDQSKYALQCTSGNTHDLLRKQPTDPITLADRVQRGYRKTCGECRVPTYKNSADTEIEAETSYGIPYRFAPVRRVMRELKAIMSSYGIPFAEEIKPEKKQDRQDFVDNVLRDATDGIGGIPKDHTDLFSADWVLCDQTGGCNGSIAYADWIEGTLQERMNKCFETLMEVGGKNLVVEMEICDIDANLDDMCAKILAAKGNVFQGNCHMSGKCLPLSFFYSPSVYSVSNSEFVRTTVEKFYEGFDAGVCPKDEDTDELKTANKAIMGDCQSLFLERMKQTLEQIREAAHMVARIGLYASNLVLSIFRLLVGTFKEAALKDINYWFEKIIAEMIAILEEIGRLIFKIIFDMSSMGGIMKKVIEWACKIIQIIGPAMHYIYCNITRPLIAWILDFIWEVINGVESTIRSLPFGGDFTFGGLRTVAESLNTFLVDGTENFCAEEFKQECEFPDEDGSNTDGQLPVPSRCWADFAPYAGVSSQLSCSASDTCLKDRTSKTTVVCDACPPVEETAFNQFGCDLLTKRCTCQTQYREKTFCTRSDQCSYDASCLLVDNPFKTTAWGVDLCKSCHTEPMCSYDGRSEVGSCVCMFTSPQLHTCQAEDIGKDVFITAASTDPCYYTFSNDVRVSNVNLLSSGSLAVAPCTRLTGIICTNVDTNGAFVVGFEIDSYSLPFGRRLMDVDVSDFFGPNTPSQQNDFALFIVNEADWNTTAEPCRSIVLAHRNSEHLGPVDTYLLRQCVFWRMIANMTHGIPDTIFLSFQDAFTAVSADVSLPMKVLRAASNVSSNILLMWPEARTFVDKLVPYLIFDNSSWISLTRGYIAQYKITPRNANHATHDDFILQHGRKLLQDNGFDLVQVENKVNFDDVRSILRSSALFQGAGINDIFQMRMFNTPNVEPLPYGRFPPVYSYWKDIDRDGKLDGDTCPVAAIFLDELISAFDLVVRTYSEGPRRLPFRTIADPMTALPKIPMSLEKKSVFYNHVPQDVTFSSMSVDAIRWVFENTIGLTKERVANVIRCSDDPEAFSLCNMARGLFTCDDESVQLCTHRTHNVIWGAAVVLVMYIALSYALLSTYLFWLVSALWLTYPNAVLWYTYRYSPLCSPLIPTCFLEDIFIPFYFYIPTHFYLPNALQTIPNCWNNTAIPAEICYKSCITHEEYNYQSITAFSAQIICEVVGQGCASSAYLPPSWLSWLLDRDSMAMDLYHKGIAYTYMQSFGVSDALTAQRMCMGVGVVFAIPYFFVVALAVLSFSAIIAFALKQGVSVTQLMLQMLIYSHMSDDDDI